MEALIVDERSRRFGFTRVKLGRVFQANHRSIHQNTWSTEGDRLVSLDTGWESGECFFVVPEGATELELVEKGDLYRCDFVRFI